MLKRIYHKLVMEALEARCLLHGGSEVFSSFPGEGEATAMPDFSLTDVNPASPTANQGVSPRDYLDQVSGWYFGNAL